MTLNVPHHTWPFIVGDEVSLCSLSGLELAVYSRLFSTSPHPAPATPAGNCSHGACPSLLLWRFSFFLPFLYYFICVSVLPEFSPYVYLVPEEVRKSTGSPAPVLRMVVSQHVCARNQTCFPISGATGAFNC